MRTAMAKIFLTGTTGYIGGTVLHRIATSQSDLQISCLARDSAKRLILQRAYPNIQIVEGDLDCTDALERLARDADIVFHLASSSHAPSANAILRGLTDTTRACPGYWIQISGASMVAAPEIKMGRYGEGLDKSYDDIRDTTEIHSLIVSNSARVVDNLILAQDSNAVRTALIVAPCIYGRGDGPVNNRSIQAPEIARTTLQRKKGFRVGNGLNVWSNVHIQDLGDLFIALLHAALSHEDGVWNKNGLYFPANGTMSFGDLCSAIAKEARNQKFIESEEFDEISPEEANSMSGHAAVLWGTNANLISSRAQAQLGWRPSCGSLQDEIPNIVREEADRLGYA